MCYHFTIVRLEIIGLLVTFATYFAEVRTELLMHAANVSAHQGFVVATEEDFATELTDRLQRASPVVGHVRE